MTCSSGIRRASAIVSSVDLSSTRMISSTRSRGIAWTVRTSVRAALRAGITTMTFASRFTVGIARTPCQNRRRMADPLISVVVPSHERPLRLRWLLNALEEQTLAREQWEVIVAHDSGPETQELLREHPLAAD